MKRHRREAWACGVGSWLSSNAAAIAKIDGAVLNNYEDLGPAFDKILAKMSPADRCIPWIVDSYREQTAALWGEQLGGERVNEFGVFKHCRDHQLYKGRLVSMNARVASAANGRFAAAFDFNISYFEDASGPCSVSDRRAFRTIDAAVRSVARHAVAWLLRCVDCPTMPKGQKAECRRAIDLIAKRFDVQIEDL